MTNAEATGSNRKTGLFESDEPANNVRTYKNINPTAVSVAARPKLKAIVRTSP